VTRFLIRALALVAAAATVALCVPGANDWSCHPSAAHPDPVVLVTSTFLSDAVNWTSLAPYLYNHGYCVYTFNYPTVHDQEAEVVAIAATSPS